jgi:hypothetical protein
MVISTGRYGRKGVCDGDIHGKVMVTYCYYILYIEGVA